MARDDIHPTSRLGHVDRGIVRDLEDLFRVAIQGMRTRIVNRSSADVPVRSGSTDLASLGQVEERLRGQEGGAFVAFHLDPWDLPGLLVIEGPLLFRLVGIFLGEKVDAEAPLYRYRTLTRVDLRVAQRVAEDALAGLCEALSSAGPSPSFRVERVSGSARWSFPMPRSTSILDATLELGPPGDPYGLMAFVLPAQIARRILPHAGEERRRGAQRGMSRVLPLPVQAVAELGRAKLSLREVRGLEVGSMIDLGRIRHVEVRAGSRCTLLCEPGVQDGMRSVRVIRRRMESTEEEEVGREPVPAR